MAGFEINLKRWSRAGSSPNRLFYVSTPASVAGPIIEGLAKAGLNARESRMDAR